MLSVLSLGAKKGFEIEVRCEGADEKEALQAILEAAERENQAAKKRQYSPINEGGPAEWSVPPGECYEKIKLLFSNVGFITMVLLYFVNVSKLCPKNKNNLKCFLIKIIAGDV